MRPLVNGQLFCSTQNNANVVRNFITARIDTMQNFELTEPVTAMPYHGGRFVVNYSILAESVNAADNLYDYVVTNWTAGAQAARILSGSRIKRTNNYDDEGQGQPDEVVREAVKP